MCINVSVKTLQRWDREGILKAKRTPTNRRYYTYDQYLEFKGLKNNVDGKIVIYTRVSTNNQKDDLINQIEFLKDFANAKGIIVDEVIKDIGSGLNYNRKISILHVFSCRIYGLRKYKKKIKEDKEIAKSIQDGDIPNRRTEK